MLHLSLAVDTSEQDKNGGPGNGDQAKIPAKRTQDKAHNRHRKHAQRDDCILQVEIRPFYDLTGGLDLIEVKPLFLQIIEEQPDIVNPETPVYEVKDGSVEFRGVRFDYKTTSQQQHRRSALFNVSFRIESGQTIGVIGGTGSGKSTLVSLISRLYDTNQGEVLVGGRNVREYDLTALRNAVSVVLQQNILFSGTILENLRWGNSNATLDDCRWACRLAQADEFISQMTNGYDTHIEQGGTNVSGGQKQRLCIARALLKRPQILVLDDSTSACDTQTDARIQRAFREELPEMTKIIIAQRISSVQHCDRILVLQGGAVTGFDTHENLLRTNQLYQEIYEIQTSDRGDFDGKMRD